MSNCFNYIIFSQTLIYNKNTYELYFISDIFDLLALKIYPSPRYLSKIVILYIGELSSTYLNEVLIILNI